MNQRPADQFRNFFLYEQRITRDMRKDLKALQDMQRERRQAQETKRKAEAERQAAKTQSQNRIGLRRSG